jgi:hypothetical protein
MRRREEDDGARPAADLAANDRPQALFGIVVLAIGQTGPADDRVANLWLRDLVVADDLVAGPRADRQVRNPDSPSPVHAVDAPVLTRPLPSVGRHLSTVRYERPGRHMLGGGAARVGDELGCREEQLANPAPLSELTSRDAV